MRQLAPALTVIESNLFDPSPALLRRWIEFDPALSAERRAALDADARAQALRAVLDAPAVGQPEARSDGAGEPPTTDPEPAPALPAHLAAAIDARLAVTACRFDPRPRPGLMLRLDQARSPRGPLDWDLNQPLAVLLAEPAGHPDVWHGWLLGAETDYATWWDLLLEEADQPFDPAVGMVQVWNPVQLWCPAASAVLGELGTNRLAVVRDLANDFLCLHPDPATANPGLLLQRTTSGDHLVLTGTPLGDGDDPRWRYQELYFAAADFVRALTRQALAELAAAAAPGWFARVRAAMRLAAAQASGWLQPAPAGALAWALRPALPLGDDSPAPAEPETWCLGDWLDLRLIPGADDASLQIHAQLRGGEPITLSLEADGHVRQAQTLDPTRPLTAPDLFAGADEGLSLWVRDQQGRCLLTVPLADLPTMGAAPPPTGGG